MIESRRRPRLLLIDRDPKRRWMTAVVLSECYDVVTSADLTDVHRQVRARMPHAIVAEVGVGEASQLRCALAADSRLRAVPVVVTGPVSGDELVDLGPRTLRLRQPCWTSTVRATVAQLLRLDPPSEVGFEFGREEPEQRLVGRRRHRLQARRRASGA